MNLRRMILGDPNGQTAFQKMKANSLNSTQNQIALFWEKDLEKTLESLESLYLNFQLKTS